MSKRKYPQELKDKVLSDYAETNNAKLVAEKYSI